MRKLCTVQRIADIQPIEGADFIEKIAIEGWAVVSQKGNFKVGDLCLYFEIDSFLPVRPEFEFLLKGTSIKKMIFEGKEVEGIRLKTKKLKGVISQGLALPLNTFKDIPNEIGFDCSEMLNVIKWEAPIPACLAGDVLGAFPTWFPRTDEERLQNFPEYLVAFKGKSFVITEKVDGTSSSFFKSQDQFGVCGRNWQLKDAPGNTYWEIARKYNLAEKLPNGFCIQGEILGEGIQKNKYKLKGHDLYVFYVYNIFESRYLLLNEMENFVKELGLKTVPILERDFVLSETMEALLEKANGRSVLSDTRREGLVFRLNDFEPKVSFKVISNSFLLKEEE